MGPQACDGIEERWIKVNPHPVPFEPFAIFCLASGSNLLDDFCQCSCEPWQIVLGCPVFPSSRSSFCFLFFFWLPRQHLIWGSHWSRKTLAWNSDTIHSEEICQDWEVRVVRWWAPDLNQKDPSEDVPEWLSHVAEDTRRGCQIERHGTDQSKQGNYAHACTYNGYVYQIWLIDVDRFIVDHCWCLSAVSCPWSVPVRRHKQFAKRNANCHKLLKVVSWSFICQNCRASLADVLRRQGYSRSYCRRSVGHVLVNCIDGTEAFGSCCQW